METVAQQRAGAQRSGTSPLYQVLAEDIVAMGVEAVFGLISDDTALLATALDTSGARFYGARHENCAIAMADGYAYAAGRLGVAVIGRGPALANGLHGAIYASRTGSPVLLIYGEAATVSQPNGLGPDYKAIDGPGVLRAAGLRTFSATSPRAARAVLADAVAAAMTGAAVSLHLPTNVQLAEIERPEKPLLNSADRTKRSSGQTAIHRGGRGASVKGHPATHRGWARGTPRRRSQGDRGARREDRCAPRYLSTRQGSVPRQS